MHPPSRSSSSPPLGRRVSRLLFLLGLGVPLGLLPPSRWFGFAALGDRASCSPPAGSPRRCFISAGPSGRGAPSRNGARPGCRARACCRSLTFVAGGGLRHRLGVLRRRSGALSACAGSLAAALARGDDLLHRHDLRLAEADPPMAQPLDRAELFCPRPDGRAFCCSTCSSGSGRCGRSASRS